MANYSELLDQINDAIYENNDQEIDALEVRAILREMVTSLGSGYLFKGIATPSSPTGTGTYEPDQNVFYLATTAGTYTYLGGLVVAAGEVAFLCYDGTWTKKSSALLSTGSIVDNLTTNDATKVLSAKQGKALKDLLDAGYLYAGVAHPGDAAVSPDANVFYIASEAGTYTNKGGLVVADGEVAILKYNGSWSKEVTGAATAAEVTALGHKIDGLALGKFYGFFPTAAGLPAGEEEGYAYVGASAPFAIYVFKNGAWSDSGSVYSYPVGNGEDIDTNEDGELQFANRISGDGMGYVILRKDKTFAEQVTAGNTIYEIRYDFDLDGASVTIPAGCVLKFVGGTISNGSLANVGKTEGATDGSIGANITSFSDEIKQIRTSDYSVNTTSSPAHNNSVFQSAIDKQIAIVIDSTPNARVDYADGEYVNADKCITFADSLYITTQGVSITGLQNFCGSLFFPNGDGIVFNTKIYAAKNQFSNLSISSKGHCFNFSNSGSANRPYNIYESTFIDLRLKSFEGDCFYDGCYGGASGDIHFSNYFHNIYLWTERYGFNGVRGQTAFFVDVLHDDYVGDSIFYNTCPNLVSKVNTSFGRVTKHFMKFDDAWYNFSATISLEDCSFEGYKEEIIIDNTANSNFSYGLMMKRCGISYYTADFPSGITLFPIKLRNLQYINFQRCGFPNADRYDSSHCLIGVFNLGQGNTGINWFTDNEFKIRSYNPSLSSWEPMIVKPKQHLKEFGAYGNYIQVPTDVIHSSLIEVQNLAYQNPETISLGNDYTTASPLNVKSNYVSLTSTSDSIISRMTFDFSDEIGLANNVKLAPMFLIFENKNAAGGSSIKFVSAYMGAAANNGDVTIYPGDVIVCVFNGYKYNVIYHGNKNNEPRTFGDTAHRPEHPINGQYYYDETINKPIWWVKTVWKDATGTSV